MDIFSLRKLLNRQVFTLCEHLGEHKPNLMAIIFFMTWPFIYHSIPEFHMYSAHHFAPFCNLDYPQCHFYYVLKDWGQRLPLKDNTCDPGVGRGAVRNVETHGTPVFVGT
jgi:hypothetical protein